MPNQNLSIPIAIVIAGALIAASLFFAGRTATPAPANNGTGQPAGDLTKIPEVTANDHILGDPNAPIKIIEYTDLECPFCKQFHATMQSIMNEYGAKGQVAWVLRNFPLVQLHPNAPKLAEAAECVSHQVSQAAYWRFLSELFTVAPAGTPFPLDRLTEVAKKAGVSDTAAFEQCVANGTYTDLIAKEFNDAVASGGQGTPHNIIITADGQRIALPGAQPYSTIKSVIDQILAETP